MKESKVSFNLFNFTKQKIPSRYFLFSLEKTLESLKIKKSAELNLILVGENKMRGLNKKFRGVDKPTDVLSFPIDFPLQESPAEILVLGDIFICPQYIIKNIKPKSLRKELEYQFVHGLIHLLGYDHEEDQNKWDAIEKDIYKKL